MNSSTFPTKILPALAVDFVFEDFATQLLQVPGGEQLLKHAAPVFEQIRGKWSTAAVIRPMRIKRIGGTAAELLLVETGETVQLATGWSGNFLHDAELVIAGGYTIGEGLEKAAAQAAKMQRYLDGYLIEQAGLALLGKAGMAVNSMIEAVAAEHDWGLGPLLSPGSVHGWELTDQPTLCSLLPLSEIGVTCGANGVLTPFNSLSFIIGIGPGFTEKKVGSPCAVCANRDTCDQRQQPRDDGG